MKIKLNIKLNYIKANSAFHPSRIGKTKTSFDWVGRGRYSSFLLVADKAMGAWLGLGVIECKPINQIGSPVNQTDSPVNHNVHRA